MKSCRVHPPDFTIPYALKIQLGGIPWIHAMCSIKRWDEIRDGEPAGNGWSCEDATLKESDPGTCPCCGQPGCTWWDKP